MKPTLHILGLPHTITTDDFSHCAFTGKVKKMSPMMRPLGYKTIHYGVAGADSGANEQVDIMSQDEQIALLGHDFTDKSRFYGDDANVETPLYVEYNRRLKSALEKWVAPNDLVLLPFGHGHQAALGSNPGIPVESGIGYPTTFARYRIYESYAWMHRQQGIHGREGDNYEWVIPNYFVEEDWPVVTKTGEYVLFFGRIGHSKGCHYFAEIAKHVPDMQFIMCGQGDPTPFLTSPNIQYLPPIEGKARAELLGNAYAVVMPSQFVEPFGGVAIEAMLCGTPVLGVTYGAFTETIKPFVNGFRCRVLADWVSALQHVQLLNREGIAATARSKYSLKAVGPAYDRAFEQIYNLHTGGGWYTEAVSLWHN